MWMPPPGWNPARPDAACIHIVANGRTLCGVATSELRKVDRWTEKSAHDHHVVTCEKCVAKGRKA